VRRRLLRALLLPGLLLGLPLVLLLLAVETEPLVRDAGPPDARAAAQARDVLDRLRTLAASDGAVAGFATDEGELNGVLAAAQRVTRGVEGRAEVTPAGLGVALSVGSAPTGTLMIAASLLLVVAVLVLVHARLVVR